VGKNLSSSDLEIGVCAEFLLLREESRYLDLIGSEIPGEGSVGLTNTSEEQEMVLIKLGQSEVLLWEMIEDWWEYDSLPLWIRGSCVEFLHLSHIQVLSTEDVDIGTNGDTSRSLSFDVQLRSLRPFVVLNRVNRACISSILERFTTNSINKCVLFVMDLGHAMPLSWFGHVGKFLWCTVTLELPHAISLNTTREEDSFAIIAYRLGNIGTKVEAIIDGLCCLSKGVEDFDLLLHEGVDAWLSSHEWDDLAVLTFVEDWGLLNLGFECAFLTVLEEEEVGLELDVGIDTVIGDDVVSDVLQIDIAINAVLHDD